MPKATLLAPALPAMPWEERSTGSQEVVWRDSQNPIIPKDLLPTSNSIFNSAVVPFEGAYAGVFRCDDRRRDMNIHGKFAILSRPSDRGHTPFGDLFYSESPHLEYWGHHRFVMQPKGGWQSTKIGVGPIPIETSEGWLLFYHGVLTSCNGFEYSFGAALLDLDQPWKILYRTASYLLGPSELYERVGDTANVIFPCAALCDAPSGRIAIYYGAADTVVGLAFTRIDEVVDFIKSNSEL